MEAPSATSAGRPFSPPKSHLQADFSSWVAATSDPSALVLGIEGFAYRDLFDPLALARLTAAFDGFFAARAPETYAAFDAYRASRGKGMTPQAVSDALLAAGPHVSSFIGKLFGVERELADLVTRTKADDPIWDFKKNFAKKRLFKAEAGSAFTKALAGGTQASGSNGAPASGINSAPATPASTRSAAAIARAALVAVGAAVADLDTGSDAEELGVAKATRALIEVDETARKAAKAGGASWTDELHARSAAVRTALVSLSDVPRSIVAVANAIASDAEDHAVVAFALDAVEAWLATRMRDHHDRAHLWPSLHAPVATNPEHLVELRRPRPDLTELFVGPDEHRRARDGFALTDLRGSPRAVEAEVDYCLFCHDRDKDSCSKGLRDAKTGELKKNAIGVALAGCPLCEKISEMHMLRRDGDSLGALALVCLDNPMCPGTGHRICNDCMKGCIFQKQEPVNIPQVETAVLTDVLNLPWGFEIYGLLTRWNPLDVRRPHAAPHNGKNVLVVGLGPAGYTLAHHLTREGFGVVAVDGLKIEPLPKELTGSHDAPPRPIRNFSDLYVDLDERVLLGFGGVSEYGITVRWDKNFLSAVFLTLSRQPLLRMYGGVRFGGTVTLEDAWKMGFDHVAIAAGAGRPTIIEMRNNLSRGIRKASDFLMALQLTGAYKRSALANLQVRLPAIVIGGGLTAIDTATELLAYYVVQAEKTAKRVAALIAERGESGARALFDVEEWEFIEEQVAHAKALGEERALAAKQKRAPNFQALLDQWGGVHLVYRKSVKDSPAYRLNHEEVIKSLEEGVRYVEHMSPVEAVLDERAAVKAVRFERQAEVDGKWRSNGEIVELPARTVCVAAGTSPNVTYEREYKGSFALDKRGQFFQAHRAFTRDDGSVAVEPVADASQGFFTSYCDGRHTVSYYGDNHPHYAGSVVKAMASAKDGFVEVATLFEPQIAADKTSAQEHQTRLRTLFARTDDELVATVHDVIRLTSTIVEVVVKAKAAARHFEPGQFYRLQNFEANSPVIEGTRLAMEGIALTGAWVDKERGLLSLIVLEMGVSSRLCAMLKPGEEVVVMGPTGSPTEIPSNETVLLCGGGLGNAVLFSIARALKDSGAKVIYFAGYRRGEDLFKQDDIEVATDQVIWCTDSGREIAPRRPQDRHVRANIVQGMARYAKGELGGELIKLSEVSRIIAIGSDKMMDAVRDARHGVLFPYLDPKHVGIGSINSPMQCMMKEVCAQCLQRHRDPQTGKETLVFSCFNQDQPLDHVDFAHLAQRLRANTAQEKLSNAWLDRLLAAGGGNIVRV